VNPWREQVKTALKNPMVLTGISQIAVSWMREHIDNSYGRAKGGGKVDHLPLKRISGSFESRSKPKGATVLGKRTVTVVGKNGKPRNVTMYRIEQEGYRNDGHPLRDTSAMYRSLAATGASQGNAIRLKMQGLKYGVYQDRGIKTRGPNYIPLTRKGKRGHGTGNNPNNEGLTRGKDYMMAWRGVTVPARPFILPTSDDLKMMGRSIYMSLKILLKGK
jgi:hypothetical protein